MRSAYRALLALTVLPLVSAQLSWDEAYAKAEAAVGGLSLEDKVGMVTGVGWENGPCIGNVSPVESIGFPALCLQDGPLGVRLANHTTAFTPGIQAASTWDRDLISQRAQFLAEEAKAMGVNVLLGPVSGPLGKIAEGGRNWEGFGSDPYLQGISMALSVEAMQAAGVQATMKHWILNEQEYKRETMSSNPTDKTVHELYVWPFADAVHAGVVAAMCSYNKINGDWSCESEYGIQELLKKQLGFPGYLMTDWNAQHSTVQSANTGLDMAMPGDDFAGGHIYWGPQLISAVNNGSVAEDRVTDMAKRVLAAWYKVGQDTAYPSPDFTRNTQSASHTDNVRACARDGIVLLKNEGNILPLSGDYPDLALVGQAARLGKHGRGECLDNGCNDGALGMGWGSGAAKYNEFVAPYDAFVAKVGEGAIALSESDDPDAAAQLAKGKSKVFVFVTADSGEGYLTVEGAAGDRNDLNLWHNGVALVKAVAAVNDNVIVVVQSVGAVILSEITALTQVKAIVWAGLGSGQNGNALVDVVFGDHSPSGKLVYTIAKQASDYNTAIIRGDDNFDEGIFVDYRHFDQAGIEPEFEFGFGLSYTDFTYSDLKVDSRATAGEAKGEIIPGGPADLWESVGTVTATVTNSGKVAGSEVAQLYLAYPEGVEAPPRQLRGFTKLPLQPGASGTATFDIRRRDLSYWDAGKRNWVVPSGTFGVFVGSSSRKTPLEGSLQAA